MVETANRETTLQFRSRVAAALEAAGRAGRWIIDASKAGEAGRPPVPFDGNGFAWVDVVSPSPRLLNALKLLADADGGDGRWRISGDWDASTGQKLSVRAPPCEAAARVLNRELAAEPGFFVARECLD